MTRIYILTKHSPEGDEVIIKSTFKQLIEMVHRATERRKSDGVSYSISAEPYVPTYKATKAQEDGR